MASNLRYYPTQEDTIIPWNADYEFPSVANKAIKISPRIQPTSGAVDVYPNSVIKFTFPAQGFLDSRKTTISFDLYLKGFDQYKDRNSLVANSSHYTYLQNNVSSIFKHAKLSYGSYDVENIQENGYLQRQLAEFSGYGGDDNDHQSIAKGVGGTSNGLLTRMLSHALIEDIDVADGVRSKIRPCTQIINGSVYAVKRYQVELPFGLAQQGKLWPTKYMASQLTFELTLASAPEVIIANNNASVISAGGLGITGASNVTGTPTYFLRNVFLLPELLEFDQSYEMKFLKGLEMGGVPLQFSTFKHFSTPLNSQNMSIAINERSRSVKAIFSFIRKQAASLRDDWGTSYGDFHNNTLISYQYRVGGRYYPASPCMNTFIDGVRTGSCEPFIELQKAIKTLGDPTIVSAINSARWNIPASLYDGLTTGEGYPSSIACSDGKLTYATTSANGFPAEGATRNSLDEGGLVLSSVFCMAACLESSNGRELSGLNAEEQSDINLMIKFQTAPPAGYEVVTYTLVDKVMIVRENNYVDINE